MTGEGGRGAMKRVRLTPVERKKMILDAALVEFSEHGFAGASTEKIARRAGLSQAGLYAHYRSKAELFEDLMTDVLMPAHRFGQDAAQEPDEGFFDKLLADSEAVMSDPRLLSVIRLLVAEGPRIPELIWLWRRKVVNPHLERSRACIRALVKSGRVRSSCLTDHFELMFSPFLHMLMSRLVFGDDDLEIRSEMEALRTAQQRMIRELVLNEDPGSGT